MIPRCQRPKRAFYISTMKMTASVSSTCYKCQRPKRAFYISTKLWSKPDKKYALCVNALNGLSTFLPLITHAGVFHADECQRPKRAFYISTENGETDYGGYFRCQRPKRAFYISTLFGNEPEVNILECVNALNGLSTFLRIVLSLICWHLFLCQRPKRAFYISTRIHFKSVYS